MQTKKIKLSPKKDGYGNISSFTVNISLKEAKKLGFINEDKTINEIEKIVTEDGLLIRKSTF